MKKPILKLSQLLALDPTERELCKLENGDYYICFTFKKNDSEMCITYEFDTNDTFLCGYVDLNGEKLCGREITKKDIKILIELM